MAQQTRSARRNRMSDRQVIPLYPERKSAVPLHAGRDVRPAPRGTAAKLLAIVALGPPILVLSAAILVALLAIFVVWLLIVAAMATTMVGCDLVHIAMWRMRQQRPTVSQRAVPARR